MASSPSSQSEEGLEKSPGSVLLEISHMLSKKAKVLSRTKSRRSFLSSASEAEEEYEDRAKVIHRKLKSRPKLKRKKDEEVNDIVLIAVCKMVENKSGSGVYSRGHHPYVEIEARRSDSYAKFVKRAAKKCGLKVDKANSELSLFKLNGARVLGSEVTVKKKEQPWTLGNYLLLMKKAPSSVKMGVGIVTIPDTVSSTSDKDFEKVSSSGDEPTVFEQHTESCGKESLLVRYIPFSEEHSRSYTLPIDRRAIFNGLVLGTYQPETDGYIVASIQRGDESLLAPIVNPTSYQLLGFAVGRHAPGFAIAWESPAIVYVTNFNRSVALYCVAAYYHEACTYTWSEI